MKQINKLDTQKNSDEVSIPINELTGYRMEALNKLFSDEIPNGFIAGSHIFNAYNFKGIVEAVDKFCTSKKNFNACCIRTGKELQQSISMELAYINSLKHCFCSQKEYYQGKLSEFNRVNEDDLKDLELEMEIIKPQENLSNKQKIVEVRNALEHHKYLICKEGIYINNPENSDPKIHARDFVAKIPYSSLQKYIGYIRFLSRKIYCISPNYSEDLIFEKGYKEQKDKIWFEVKRSPQKEIDSISKLVDTEQQFQNLLNKSDIYNLQLSEKQQDMISLFFENNKLKLNHSNLEYIALSQDHNRKDIVMLCIMEKLLEEKFSGGNFEQLKKDIDILKLVKRLIWGNKTNTVEDAIYSSGWENGEKSHDCSVVRELGENLVSGGKIITSVNRRQDYLNYVDKFFKKRGFKYEEENINLGPCFIKEGLWGKIETIIPLGIISSLLDNLHTEKLCVERVFKEFPQWIKIQFIKTIFIDGLAEVPSEWNQKPNINDKFTVCEHIRNALTHNTYTTFFGVDTILLRDGYNKSTGQWEREESFNINDLYNLPFKKKGEDWRIE